jgi:hypothetical protein
MNHPTSWATPPRSAKPCSIHRIFEHFEEVAKKIFLTAPADLTYAEQKSAAISEASQYTSDFEHFEEIAKNLSYRLR